MMKCSTLLAVVLVLFALHTRHLASGECLGEIVQRLVDEVEALKARLHKAEIEVGFMVYFSKDVGDKGVSLPRDTPLVFDRAITNVGNAYSAEDGKFTAPVSGMYAFSLRLMATVYGDTYLAIQKNGQRIMAVYAQGGETHNYGQASSGQIILQLKAGDKIWVQWAQLAEPHVRGATNTVFSGVLITPESA